MKAVLLRSYGGVDQLEYTDVPTPKPKEGEILVKVLGSSVNPIDYKIRSGMVKERMPVEFPFILGRDVAGEVVAAGPDVNDFAPGTQVLGLVSHSYAEFLLAKPEELAPAPEGLSHEQAGVLPLVLLTGSQLIELGVAPKPGQTVLITGAVGSVGRTAVHVAKQHGARVIAGVKKAQLEKAQDLDCYQAIALDVPDALQSIPELDAIADTVGGKVVGTLISKVRKNGVVASVAGGDGPAKQAGLRTVAFMAKPNSKRLAELASDIKAGSFTIPIGRTYKLSEIRKAQEEAEMGGLGKIALQP